MLHVTTFNMYHHKGAVYGSISDTVEDTLIDIITGL